MSATRAGTAAMKSASIKATPEAGRVAVLLGASGATGKVLLPLLLDDSRYATVVTLSRRKLGFRHPRLDDRIVDFDHLAAGFEGLRADDCYCTFGTTIRIAGSEAAMTRIDHDYVVAFAEAGTWEPVEDLLRDVTASCVDAAEPRGAAPDVRGRH